MLPSPRLVCFILRRMFLRRSVGKQRPDGGGLHEGGATVPLPAPSPSPTPTGRGGACAQLSVRGVTHTCCPRLDTQKHGLRACSCRQTSALEPRGRTCVVRSFGRPPHAPSSLFSFAPCPSCAGQVRSQVSGSGSSGRVVPLC